jgi:hypothetical protein
MAERFCSFKCLAGLAVVTGSLIATWAHAADGANGQNGNGAGAPTITNVAPLKGGAGGDGTDGGKGGVDGYFNAGACCRTISPSFTV